MTDQYYSQRLAAERLQRVYDLAPPRIQQYLRSEIEYVLELMPARAEVLELGCGYGRVLKGVAPRAALLAGIDTSLASLQLAQRFCANLSHVHLAGMDASHLAFGERTFDVVICIQNGISAFHIDQKRLINESVRVLRPGGRALFASYSEKFWDVRLDWFERQSQLGLVGEIDREKTGHGILVCKDGFTATTVSASEFRALTNHLDAKVEIAEIDESSLFCVIRV